MKVTLDRSVDAAYISFESSLGPAANVYPCHPILVGGQITLDFDSDGKLIGIEVMDASKKLTQDLLNEAEIIG
jgi:uncharacterized protein YuzE